MKIDIKSKLFADRSRIIHGDRYDYSLVKYINSKTKVKILCPVHGEFEQTPHNHLHGNGCRSCANDNKTLTKSGFIDKSNIIHNNKYCYDLVEYLNNVTKVKIICLEHGIFEQRAGNHLRGVGCRKCAIRNKALSQYSDGPTFINKSGIIHNNIYDYSLVKYINNTFKVIIICPIHGEFLQSPAAHLKGQGCPKCTKYKSYDECDYIKKVVSVHNNKYDYSLVNYITIKDDISIICPIHGIFEQRADHHMNGHGCPYCFGSISKQEISLVDFIKSIYNGEIITNTRKIIKPYELDIYLPEKQVAFEYNGTFWHEEGVRKPIGYHQMKTSLCSNKGVKLHHIWEKDWMNDREYIKNVIISTIGG